jgi:hypothetical protein
LFVLSLLLSAGKNGFQALLQLLKSIRRDTGHLEAREEIVARGD